MANAENKPTNVEDETINYLLPALVDSLDVNAVFDKFLRENLINSGTHERVASLLSNGQTSEAVRETMTKIKRSAPGYLAKLIEVLKSEERSKHFGDRIEQEYNTRLERQSAQRKASHDLRETSHDQPQKQTKEHNQTVCDVNRIIDLYVAAIDQHKDKLLDRQRLMSYKIYLIEAGALTAKEFNDIEKKHKRNKPKMDEIVELLLRERQLQRYIGLSAVMFCYAEVDAEEMFPFVDELGDLHPVKGQLTVKKNTKRSSPKHVAVATTATDWSQSSPDNSAPLAPPTIPATGYKYKLLWMSDDFLTVQSVLKDLTPSSSLSPAIHTEQITYWETVLFNEIQLYLTYTEEADKIAQTCVHMMERFRPNIALLSGVCTVSNKIGGVRLGDIIVGEAVIKISSGADVKGERYRAQTKQALSRVISDLKVESKRWERNGELSLQHYKNKIPLRPMTYQRLWYTRLYLELNSEAADRTGWLEANGWKMTEKFSGRTNRTVLEQQMPKLLENFKNDRINKRYWERDDGKIFPVKPVHPELLGYCERSIKIGGTEFPKQHSTDTAIHFASILTTDSNPTADDIDHGNRISNTVTAADLDTFSFYDSVEKYNDCKFFLSVKGVHLMDDGMSDQADSDYTEYARLSSASYALQAVKHLYHKTIIE